MKLKYNVEDRLPMGALATYSLQWFVLCIAVVSTSVFVAQGTPEEKLFYAQKLFAVIGLTGLVQVIWGHRLPIVAGPAAVLLVGVISALASNASTDGIYTSIAIGGVIVALLTLGNTMHYVQRIFTPRIIVVILMLIAFTLAPTISNKLLFSPFATHDEHTFALIFTLVGTIIMVIMNRTLKGVAKSLIVPIALIVGSIVYFALFTMPERHSSAVSLDNMFIDEVSFDASLIVAFVVCYIALIINDIGSIESLGKMLQSDNMPHRLKRGMAITGIMNIVAGGMGVLGPVNFSMSPGIIASTGCAARRALIPATIALTLCALSPDVIWVLTAIPSPVIGVILLYLMGTQLAASFEMLQSTKSAETFADALTMGVPLMVALVFQLMPTGVAPKLLEPLMGNGFAMGVLMVIVMEHVINRGKK
jgi:xanthine/uracil permease